MAKIEQKHLEGLVFRTSTPKVKKEDGVEKIRNTPVERPLTLDDIMSQRDAGDSFVIVTKDGQKYTIPKDLSAGQAGKEKEKEKKEGK